MLGLILRYFINIKTLKFNLNLACLCVCVFFQRTRATQIIPCSVSQLMSASQADEAFKVGDVEVAQVKQSKLHES